MVNGYCDRDNALKQSIQLILSTNKYECDIFFTDYGSQLYTLIGKSFEYIKLSAPVMIEEALLKDNRILSVSDFSFTRVGDIIFIYFNVKSTYNDIRINYTFLGGE